MVCRLRQIAQGVRRLHNSVRVGRMVEIHMTHSNLHGLALNFDKAQDRAFLGLQKTATLSAINLKAKHVLEKTQIYR